MKKPRTALVIMTVVAIVLAMASPAVAKKRDKPGKPDRPPTVEIGRTCAEMLARDTAWLAGSYEDGVYTVPAEGGCVDIRPEHADPQTWSVTWSDGHSDDDEKRFRSLAFVFERGIHGTVWAREEVDTPSGAVGMHVAPDGAEGEPLVFIAMPKVQNRWSAIIVTLTPGT